MYFTSELVDEGGASNLEPRNFCFSVHRRPVLSVASFPNRCGKFLEGSSAFFKLLRIAQSWFEFARHPRTSSRGEGRRSQAGFFLNLFKSGVGTAATVVSKGILNLELEIAGAARRYKFPLNQESSLVPFYHRSKTNVRKIDQDSQESPGWSVEKE